MIFCNSVSKISDKLTKVERKRCTVCRSLDVFVLVHLDLDTLLGREFRDHDARQDLFVISSICFTLESVVKRMQVGSIHDKVHMEGLNVISNYINIIK